MDWQQKLAALQSLTETCLRMRKPGDWYVSARMREVVESGGCILRGEYGNGATPEAAVNDDFDRVAKAGHPLKIDNARYVRWNGFMWESLTTEMACSLARKPRVAEGGAS